MRHLSGSQKRKKHADEQQQSETLLSKVPKLTSFFISPSSSSTTASATAETPSVSVDPSASELQIEGRYFQICN
jgi:hypothetical protein